MTDPSPKAQAPEEFRKRATISLDENQRDALKRKVCLNAPFADRLSTILAAKLAFLEPYCSESFHILDELLYMEGLARPTQTKDATPFKRPPLVGFWHKHYFSARHMPTNMMVRWGMEQRREQRENGLGNKDLDRLMQDYLDRYEGQLGEVWLGEFIQQICVGAFEERAQSRRLTGDWIVFAMHEGQRYYLDVVPHSASQDSEGLFQHLKQNTGIEFPFLFP
ncbi:hypothetical protein EQ845_31360 [Pseudomonas putida]|uniref:hypothetical protein n=1 Tax=Pseudomonas putida TaxID=303 RepID=UPI00117B96EC|nr:hypothetical protein [Pseudomonas putida]TRO27680.1 hypothetical protein EQ845_31360 [Pseudomonas putida]